MSLSYTNLPIYVGHVNSSEPTMPSEQHAMLPAASASVSYGAQAEPNKKLGKAISQTDQYNIRGPLSAQLSFQTFLVNDMPYLESGYAFLSGSLPETGFFPVQLGSGVFKKCYMQDYVVSIQPYQPVTVDITFVSLDPPTEQEISGDPNPYANPFNVEPPFDGDDFVYGHTCSVENVTDVVGAAQSSITYRRSFGRTPVFTLGSINATDVRLNSIEAETTITSTGLENLINFSGDTTANDIAIGLNTTKGDSIRYFTGIVVSGGAEVHQESYAVGGGDTLETTATLSEIIL
jgi:hypothetical protein